MLSILLCGEIIMVCVLLRLESEAMTDVVMTNDVIVINVVMTIFSGWSCYNIECD